MRISLISLVGLLLFALIGCQASPTAVKDSPTLENKEAVSSASAIATSTVSPTGEWQTYRNAQAGYSVTYPADWLISESVGGNGEFVTTFMAPDNKQGLAVSVLKGEATGAETPDMPNTRCQQVTISGFPGRRCLDTVAFNISTIFSGNGKQFSIVTIGKHLDQDMYQSFLENFTVTP